MNLSKSRYCKGIQCPKILWLEEHKSEERDDSVMDQRVLDTGNKVGDLAMGYFGDFTEVPYNDNKSIMIEETKQLLNENTGIICEASFSYDGNFSSVDILRRLENSKKEKSYEIIEVKSSTEVKPIYYDDTAFQYHVLTSCGLYIKKVSVMFINSNYVRGEGNLDIQSIFSIQDCTKEVLALQKEVILNIEKFKEIVINKKEPEIKIGVQCREPYNCVYKNYCWRHIPQDSIFTISGRALRFNKKLELYEKGIVTIEQLLENAKNQQIEINDSTRLQAETFFHNKPPAINKKEIQKFLNTLKWPLYFLDFETLQEAIPQYKGMRPYMQMTFQYSLHIQKALGACLEHKEFLAKENTDPRLKLAEQLCADVPKNVCVVAYNMSFEKSRIKELADYSTNDLPKISSHLMSIHDNIIDLMLPFQSFAYYSNELGGSYSIKKVLPALCPNDSELDYKALNLVQNGGDAQAVYAQLCNNHNELSANEKVQIKTALLAYCRLDTLAMVKILEKLQQMCL